MPADVLQAPRLPALYREVFVYAGLPLPPGERFVLRSGDEPPGLFAALLEEAFLEDEAEALVWEGVDPPDCHHLGPWQVVIRPGFDTPCPVAGELARALGPALAVRRGVARRAGPAAGKHLGRRPRGGAGRRGAVPGGGGPL
jgi:hypothetical protein